MAVKTKLPIGIEDFEEIRTLGYYYIDKTGLNNLKVYTVMDVRYNEHFGFSDQEVREILEYYGFMDQYEAVKEWYDGYRFGDLGIYCPWDVINYCGDLRDGSVMEPQNYWVNTSGNDIVRRFISRAGAAARYEMELLLNGSSIRKKIRQELTYRDLDSDTDNLWSILLTTGYLTQCGEQDGGMTELAIPNREIGWIFKEQIQECICHRGRFYGLSGKNHQYPRYKCPEGRKGEFLSRHTAGTFRVHGGMDRQV